MLFKTERYHLLSKNLFVFFLFARKVNEIVSLFTWNVNMDKKLKSNNSKTPENKWIAPSNFYPIRLSRVGIRGQMSISNYWTPMTVWIYRFRSFINSSISLSKPQFLIRPIDMHLIDTPRSPLSEESLNFLIELDSQKLELPCKYVDLKVPFSADRRRKMKVTNRWSWFQCANWFIKAVVTFF